MDEIVFYRLCKCCGGCRRGQLIVFELFVEIQSNMSYAKNGKSPSPSQETFGDCNANKMVVPLSVIRKIFG